jgi:hypothetical protein
MGTKLVLQIVVLDQTWRKIHVCGGAGYYLVLKRHSVQDSLCLSHEAVVFATCKSGRLTYAPRGWIMKD